MDGKIIGTIIACAIMAVCAVFFGYKASEKEEKGQSMGCTGACGSCKSHCESGYKIEKPAAISAAAKIKELEEENKI